MLAFALTLVRPYWKRVLLITVATLVETAMGLAAPWPLKIVLDSVIGSRPLPMLFNLMPYAPYGPMAILNIAVIATVIIAIAQSVSAYVDAYFTVSLGQGIAHDLRRSV
jgi:subfamily B ATP-binding cassette protein MsbA